MRFRSVASVMLPLPLTIVLCLCVGPIAVAGDLSLEFTGLSNPGNGWVQGYVDDFAGESLMGLFNPSYLGTAGDRWTSDPTGATSYPPNDVLLVNIGAGLTQGDHWGGGIITWELGQPYHTWAGSNVGDDESTGTDPWPNGADTIFSTFTADVAGTYSITAAWDLVDGDHAADVEVLINGSSAFTGSIDNTNVGVSDLASFVTSATLSIGDTVSFRTTPDDVNGGSAALDAIVAIPTLDLNINRQTGLVTIDNVSTAPLSIAGYSLTSDAGALDPSGWTSLASGPGSDWIEFSTAPTEISEGSLGIQEIPAGGSLNLGQLWLTTPYEDIDFNVVLADNSVLTINPLYSGSVIQSGDLYGDGNITAADWAAFKSGQSSDLTGLGLAGAYQKGDLDGDLDNDFSDFRAFKAIFEAANPSMSLSEIPEPASLFLLVLGAAAVAGRRARSTTIKAAAGRVLAVVILLAATAPTVSAASLLDDFTGASNPGNGWAHGYEDDFAGDSLMGLFNPGTSGNAGDRWTSDPTGATSYPPNDVLLVNIGVGRTETNHWGGGTITWESGQSYHTWAGSNVGDDETSGTDPWPNGADTIFSTFTIDLAGTYNISADWDLVDGDHAAGVEVLINGSSAFTGSIDNSNIGVSDLASFATTVPLAIGDTVSFRTTPNDTDGGATALDALITNAVAQTLTLQVDQATGQMQIANLSGNPIDFDYYRIAGPAGSLVSSGFNGIGGDLPAFAAGTGAGDGWEIGAGTADQELVESYLTGSSVLQDGEVLPLGAAYNTSLGSEELAFSIGIAGDDLIDGVFDYDASFGLAGDFDGDGDVDIADLMLWQRGGSPTPGSQSDLMDWKNAFDGNPVSSISMVPEPSAGLLCLLGLGAMATRRSRWSRRRTASLGLLIGAALLVMAPEAQATRTADRLYSFGEDVDESGAVNDTVGQNSVNGKALDSVYDDNINYLDAQDLIVNGDPQYVNPANPAVPGSTLAASFDGDGDFLYTDRLGLPSSCVTDASGVRDYSGIFNRGYQFWVKPGSNTTLQTVVMDTNQHGVRITADGNWSMRYAGFDYDSGVPVTIDTWHHVMLVHPIGGIGPKNGSYLYVDGVAVAAAGSSYSGGDNNALTIGAATGNIDDEDPANDPGVLGEFFTGVIDELEMFVLSRSTETLTNWGDFEFAADNTYAASVVATLTPGDLTGDGFVTGDGTGSVLTDDVSAFVANYGYKNVINEKVVGDLSTRALGDLDFDGKVSILDWAILRANHPNAGSLAALSDLIGAPVPEPSGAVLVAAGVFALLGRRSKK